MTNYIEEMMEIAGVEPKYYYDVTLQDTIKSEEKFPLKSCTKGEVISYCRDKENYGYCKVDKVLKVYPDFTAEKQLEVIKLNQILTIIGKKPIILHKNNNTFFLVFMKENIEEQ